MVAAGWAQDAGYSEPKPFRRLSDSGRGSRSLPLRHYGATFERHRAAGLARRGLAGAGSAPHACGGTRYVDANRVRGQARQFGAVLRQNLVGQGL